jgi:O-antigen/teichoic acid export membrane protein
MSLRRDTILNLIGAGIPPLAAAVFIPFLLGRLGDESFGILALLWGLIGYFSLFDMGIGRALTFELSRLRGESVASQIPPTLRAGLIMTGAAGLVGAALMLILTGPLVHSWLKIKPALQPQALLAFRIAALGVVPTTIASGMRGALEGMGRFGASNLNRILLGFLMAAVPTLSILLHGPELGYIALYLVLARLIVLVGISFQLRAELTGRGAALTRAHARNLFTYGFWLSLTGIVSPLMTYGDRFFVSAAIGVGELPFYAIPQEGLQRLLIIPASLSSALLPRLTSLGQAEAAAAYRTNFRRVSLAMLGICTITALVAYPGLSWWLSPEFARKSFPLVLVLLVGVWTNSMATVPYTLLHAHGNPRITAIFHMVELVLYLGAIWFLTRWLGLLGAALAWSMRTTLDLILLRFAAQKALPDFGRLRSHGI